MLWALKAWPQRWQNLASGVARGVLQVGQGAFTMIRARAENTAGYRCEKTVVVKGAKSDERSR